MYFMLWKLAWLIDLAGRQTAETLLILILNAFVFSKLFYCSSVWSNTSKTNVKKCNWFRIVLGLQKYDHVSEGLKSLRWLPIADKLLLNVPVMVHKCLNGRAPDYLRQKFTRRQAHHDRNTRYKKDLNLPRCRLKLGSDLLPLEGLLIGTNYPKTYRK